MALLGRCMWTTISFPQCPSNIIHKTNFKPYHLRKGKLQTMPNMSGPHDSDGLGIIGMQFNDI